MDVWIEGWKKKKRWKDFEIPIKKLKKYAEIRKIGGTITLSGLNKLLFAGNGG